MPSNHECLMKFLTLAAEMVKGYATSLSMFTKYNVDSVISIMIVRENTNQMISLLPCLTVSLPGGKIGPNLIRVLFLKSLLIWFFDVRRQRVSQGSRMRLVLTI